MVDIWPIAALPTVAGVALKSTSIIVQRISWFNQIPPRQASRNVHEKFTWKLLSNAFINRSLFLFMLLRGASIIEACVQAFSFTQTISLSWDLLQIGINEQICYSHTWDSIFRLIPNTNLMPDVPLVMHTHVKTKRCHHEVCHLNVFCEESGRYLWQVQTHD